MRETDGGQAPGAVLGAEWAVAWLRESARVVAERREELIELDRVIGDGDHGENLDRGFRAIVEKLDEALPNTAGEALKLAAMTLIGKVGGAAGPLYGTAFLRAAAVAGDRAVDGAVVAELLAAARDGIVARGKAEPGDKTMVDAWTPAVEAAATTASTGGSAADTLAAAAIAAAEGARATVALVARKGRASYLGERSAGHEDPGAASTVLLLRAAADVARGGA